MNSSATVLTDVTSLVVNYANATTDHYPVFTRFAFDPAILVLPSRLLEFSAYKDGAVSKLIWITAQEINSSRFVIERSFNGTNWEVVATVTAAGNSNAPLTYSISDFNPVKGLNLYRLRMIDADNKFELSAIRKVNFDRSTQYNIYPNPASAQLFISADNSLGLHGQIDILNAQGQKVIQKTVPSGIRSVTINISELQSGIHFIRITAKDGSVSIDKFVKQ